MMTIDILDILPGNCSIDLLSSNKRKKNYTEFQLFIVVPHSQLIYGIIIYTHRSFIDVFVERPVDYTIDRNSNTNIFGEQTKGSIAFLLLVLLYTTFTREHRHVYIKYKNYTWSISKLILFLSILFLCCSSINFHRLFFFFFYFFG